LAVGRQVELGVDVIRQEEPARRRPSTRRQLATLPWRHIRSPTNQRPRPRPHWDPAMRGAGLTGQEPCIPGRRNYVDRVSHPW